jgi:hypothetical protein
VLPFVTFRKQPSAYPFFGDTHIAMRARKTGCWRASMISTVTGSLAAAPKTGCVSKWGGR